MSGRGGTLLAKSTGAAAPVATSTSSARIVLGPTKPLTQFRYIDGTKGPRVSSSAILKGMSAGNIITALKANVPKRAGGAAAGIPGYIIYIITLAQLIGICLADNLHDGAGGFRNKAEAQAELVKAALMKAFSNITRGECSVIPTCLTANMSPKVIQSNIEDSTVSYFEDNTDDYLQRPSPDAKATYDQIIALADVNAVAITQRIKYDTFRILPGAQSVKELTGGEESIANKKKITNFILTFLLGRSEAETYMTFDASPMSVGKLFRGHENVCGLVIPQNIGDSATTSFKQLGAEPDMYIFPTNDDNGRFYAQRNILSYKELNIFYQNDGFCSKFPFKMSFGLETVGEEGPKAKVIVDAVARGGAVAAAAAAAAAAPAKAEVSLSYEKSGYTQGPSLDYLIDLMLAAQSPAGSLGNITTSSGCLRIGDVIKGDIDRIVRATKGGVFMDIKRGGDEDVPDAVLSLLKSSFIRDGKFIIAVTLDRLCSLVYRLLGIPCIYHHGDELTLYKNKATDRGVTPEILAAFKVAKDARFVAEYGPLVASYKDNLANLGRFASSIKTVYDCERNNLHKEKFADIFKRLKVVYDTATEAKAIIAAAAAPIEATRPNIEAYLKIFNDKGVDTNFLIGLKPVLDTPIDSIVFNPAHDYGYLNYSADTVDTILKAYNGYTNIKERSSKSREPINYDAILNKPDGYNTLLGEFTKSFFDKGNGEIIYHGYAFLIAPAPAAAAAGAANFRKQINDYEKASLNVSQNPIGSVAMSVARKALDGPRREAIAASNYLRDLLTTATDPSALVAVPAGLGCIMAGGAYQRGGAYSEDHVTLFKDICERAATFINSEIGRIYPRAVQRYAIEQLIDALERWGETKVKVMDVAVQKLRYTRFDNSYKFANTLLPGHLASRDTLTVDGLKQIIMDASLNVFPNIDDLILRVPESTSTAVLLDLCIHWSTGIKIDPLDKSLVAVTTLLDPYNDTGAIAAAAAAADPSTIAAAAAAAETTILDSSNNIIATGIKLGYPLLFIGAAEDNSESRTLLLKKLLGSDPVKGIYSRVTMYSLITLAFFDDLFKGNVGKRTSLLISSLGELPARARGFDITPAGRWDLLPSFITNILIQINNNNLSPEALGLMRGGARSTKYRHTRRRGSKRNYNRTAKRGRRHTRRHKD